MKLTLFQMSATPDDTPRIDRIIAAMEKAARDGADCLVAPELALSGYGAGDAFADLAQAADGTWATRLQAAAQRIGISVITGFPEQDGDARYISAMAVFRDGTPAFIYRKAFLYEAYENAHFITGGMSAHTFDMEGLRVGMLICFDVEFPECTRALAQAGADLIVVPTALPRLPRCAFIPECVVPVRAHENQLFVAYCDHADADDLFAYQGQSCIAAPDGVLLAMAPKSGSAMISADIDPAAYATSRKANPYLHELAAKQEA